MSESITSVTAARDQLADVMTAARADGYRVFLGEIGFRADRTTDDGHPASEAWQDFVGYATTNADTLIGYAWWACGEPGWWDDVGADGGGHFAVTPTDGATYTGDTVNMEMIEADF